MASQTPLIIGYNNYLWATLAATPTADQTATGFPASNVQLDMRKATWRSTDALASHYLSFDLGIVRTSTMIAMLDPNTTDNANSITLTGYSDAYSTATYGPAQPDYKNLTAAGATEPALNRYVMWTTALPAGTRYWRITFSQVPMFDAFTSAGKVFIGQSYTLAKNYSHGIVANAVDLSVSTGTPTGGENTLRRPTRWEMAFDVNLFTISDATNLRTIVDTVGQFSPCICCFNVDADPARRTLYGRFAKNPSFVWTAAQLYNVTGYGFRELI